MTSDDASTNRGRGRRLARAAIYGLLTAVVLIGVGFLVRSKWDPLIDLDDGAITRMTAVTRSTPGMLSFLLTWQAITQPWVLHIIGTLVCLWVWFGKGMRTRAWWAFATLMAAWFLGFIAKEVVQRARPVVEDPVSQAPGYSFPSGHALNSAAFAATMIVLLWPIVTGALARRLLVGLGALVVLVTALDRTFLGVHYPSDVTVGVVTGVGLVLASYAGYSGWKPQDAGATSDPDDPDGLAQHVSPGGRPSSGSPERRTEES